MKSPVLSIVMCLSTVVGSGFICQKASAQQAGTSPVKIFIMVGQSNMLGHGEIGPVTSEGTLEYIATPANDPNGDYAFLGSPGAWVVRDDVWIRDQDEDLGGLTPGYGARTELVGPEIGFGHFMGDLNDQQIIIVKAAWGGKDLANDFRPPSSGGTTGFYYNEVLRLVTEMTDDLDTDPSSYFPDYDFGGGYEIAGFCWHQGYNDRIDAGRSAEYETNMANFIRDMRIDLGVPGMPFVIATTGMGGEPTYTTVELAQMEMTNTTKYPDFDGNVAVIDTRSTYEGLEFWQDAANSPANQGFHWNRNAKTYTNIGLAMGDAMSTLSPARCPFRLRGSGGSGGVTLTWQNGSELPTSVRVLRNSVEIAAAAPANPASFIDAAAEPGVLDYELQFTMPGDPCDPLTLSFDAGITDLAGYRSPGGIVLTWTNNLDYTAIEVRRDGALLEPSLSGTATTYTDAAPPSAGLVTYSVVPTNGSAAPTELQINLDGPPSGNAVIYEPFDYTVGGLNLQGGAEAGLDGTWFANSTTLVTAGTFTYGDLPVGGAKLSDFTGSQNRFGGSRSILPSALAANGLLDHGAELWFSFITGIQEGANRTNSRLAVALAAGPFGGGNGDFFISGGTGVGFDMGAGVPRAASFPADTGGSSRASNTSPQYQVSEFDLIVGRITWGADASSPDTIELFKPGTDLVLPASPISTHTVVVDQSTYDTLTFRRGDRPMLDEIRFGQSYNDVIGADLIAPDIDPPTPDPLTWDSVPAQAGDSQVTMTATTATDPGGVEYYFEEMSGNPGGSDSGWQNSATYTDEGLNSGTTYSYRVKARDKSSNANETGWSSTESATTAAPDTLPPTPSPMTWDAVPTAISPTEVTMTATGANDPSGVEYYFTETTGNPGGDDSGWQDNPTYIDTGLDPMTNYAYTVTARDKSSAANEGAPSSPAASVTTPGLPSGPGGAVIYEPFDYDAGNIAGNDGGTGFGAAWSNTRNSPQVDYPGKTWGALTAAGGFAKGNAWSGIQRPIGNSLFEAGLMADGATLWFSIVFDLEGQNLSNADLNMSLGTDRFVSSTFGDREQLLGVGSEGIGVTHSGGVIEGVYWQDVGNDGVGERTENDSNLSMGAGRALIVGRIDWGANATADESLTLYAPDTNLNQGSPIMATWMLPALDQSVFDTLAIQFKDTAEVDEIRFGASYDDVVGLGGAVAPYDSWASTNAPGQTPEEDFDLDGVENGVEFVLGGDKDTNDLDKLPGVQASGGDLVFNFERDQASIDPSVVVTIEVGTDLTSWPSTFNVGADTGSSDSGVTVTKDSPAAGTDTVSLSVPQAPDAKKFARLKVEIAP